MTESATPAERTSVAESGDLVAEAGAPAPPRQRRRMVIAAAIVAALAPHRVRVLPLGLRQPPQAVPTATPEASASGPPSTAEIYSALAPSVVSIEALNLDGKVTSTGTGVIANVDGVILTALHVVRGAGTIRVTFADGTESAATLIGADPTIDIAALTAATLPTVVVPAVLGSSGRMSVGDSVVAIGNPFGLTSSATAGVVSGLNRVATGMDGTRLNGLIQFDAAVNPGSSGGPLVNTRGETVGVVVALANPTRAGTFIGIGFAVPIGAAVGAGSDGPGPQQ